MRKHAKFARERAYFNANYDINIFNDWANNKSRCTS